MLGERGTGKQRLASRLHRRWGGRGKIVVVDGSLPHGHKADLFSYRSGREWEDRGMLVLAHVGVIDRDVLSSILRSSRLRLGKTDGWELVATAVDHASLAGLDRDYWNRDLVHAPRLEMPPLRERRPDMPQLVRELMPTLCDDACEDHKAISSEALDALGAYQWPENVAELSMVLEHAVLAASGRARVELSDLPRKFRGSAEVVAGEPAEWPSLAEVEQQWIVRTLQRCGGSRALAASALGIHPNTLGRKLKELGIGRTRAAHGAHGGG